MKNIFSLQQISKTLNSDANSVSRQYILNLRADFIRIKNENPKLKQSEIADQLSYSSSTLQRYRKDINLLSPYRMLSNNTNKRTKKASNTNFNINQHLKHELKGYQMTSNDFKRSQSISEFLLKFNPLKFKTKRKVKQMLELTINI